MRIPWRIALLLLFAGCAHRTPAIAPTAPLVPAEVDVLYTFELLPAPFRMVRVSVATRGAESGATTFAFGGDSRVEDAVHGVSAVDASRRPVASSRSTPTEWIVRHVPSEPLELSYYLVSPPTSSVEPRAFTAVIASETLFRLHGGAGLAIPTDRLDRTQRIEVRWRGFDGVGWKVASSFSADQHGFRFESPLRDLRRALFLAGDLRLHMRTVRGSRLQFAVRADLGSSDEEFVDRATRIVEAERAFFSDFDRAYYLLAMLEVGASSGDHQPATAGVLMANTLAVFVPPGAGGSAEASRRQAVEMTLASTLLGEWIGQRITTSGPTALGHWFVGGFKEFYARRLLYRAGLLSLDEYAADLNRRVESYLLDPERGATNEQIAAASPVRPSLRDVAAQRGALVALLVDGEIRRGTDGERSLDDLMRELHERATQGGHTFDTDELLFAIERYTTREFAIGMRAIIERGAVPRFPSDLLVPCLSMQVGVRGGYELGFDFEASRKTRVISGVIPGSRAYQAGLRDGQRLAQWELTPGKPDEPVSLTVIDAGHPRLVFYVPIAAGVPVPSFTIGNHPAACPEVL